MVALDARAAVVAAIRTESSMGLGASLAAIEGRLSKRMLPEHIQATIAELIVDGTVRVDDFDGYTVARELGQVQPSRMRKPTA